MLSHSGSSLLYCNVSKVRFTWRATKVEYVQAFPCYTLLQFDERSTARSPVRFFYFLHIVHESLVEMLVNLAIESCRYMYSISPFRESAEDLSVAEINKVEITNLVFDYYRRRSQSDRLEGNWVEWVDVVLFKCVC